MGVLAVFSYGASVIHLLHPIHVLPELLHLGSKLLILPFESLALQHVLMPVILQPLLLILDLFHVSPLPLLFGTVFEQECRPSLLG
jgi:hypothetical protein